MAANRIVPENSEERLIYGAIVGAWGFYLLGALYIVGPVLGFLLLGKVLWRHAIAPAEPRLRPAPVPVGVWLWIAGMAAMLLALLVAHVQNDLGVAQTVKSAIGWTKGWALLAVFPLAGACLRVRPELLARACGWFAVQTLLITPLLFAAAFAHLPARLYVSPLQIVGGPGPEFFSVFLYILDPPQGTPRWLFIAPWAPAAGLLGDMIFLFAGFERNPRFKAAGMLAGVLMAVLTKSRMALLFLVVVPPLVWVLARLGRPAMLAAGAAGCGLLGLVADSALRAIDDAVAAFRGARADSTRVREALGRIAVDRWRDEAPLWGHGIVERGPHHVEFMPIGSHHTWFGLLFVKGLVGVAALAVPMAWTFAEMLLLAQVSRLGRLGLSFCLMLIFYTFGENLEILAYLFWPCLVALGCAFGEAAACRVPRVAARAAGPVGGEPALATR